VLRGPRAEHRPLARHRFATAHSGIGSLPGNEPLDRRHHGVLDVDERHAHARRRVARAGFARGNNPRHRRPPHALTHELDRERKTPADRERLLGADKEASFAEVERVGLEALFESALVCDAQPRDANAVCDASLLHVD
jgi:hypothetical protein